MIQLRFKLKRLKEEVTWILKKEELLRNFKSKPTHSTLMPTPNPFHEQISLHSTAVTWLEPQHSLARQALRTPNLALLKMQSTQTF